MTDEDPAGEELTGQGAGTLLTENEAVPLPARSVAPGTVLAFTPSGDQRPIPTGRSFPLACIEDGFDPAAFGIGKLGVVSGLSREAEIDATAAAPLGVPVIRPPRPNDSVALDRGKDGHHGLMTLVIACMLATAGWFVVDAPETCAASDLSQLDIASGSVVDAVARRIVTAESNGDAAAKNRLSSATGAGQFLDGTWLQMIHTHRRDLTELSEVEILGLRGDPDLSREMVARFAEKNATILARRCLPVTAGTLYLSHFAGGAGAAAVLSAPAHADAATTMANADKSGRTTRDMIVKANPFLRGFTVADLQSWADRKIAATQGHHLPQM